MKTGVCLVVGIWGLLVVGANAQDPELKSIFNGRDLAGWDVPKSNIWWTAKEGVCVGQSDATQTGSILWTSTEYRDFIVEVEFRMGKEGVIDSGVFLRSENEQIQIGISGSLKRDMTASPYIASKKGYPVEAEGVADLLKAHEWNTLRIRARGGAYTTWLNGKEVMNYRSDTAVESGRIGFQLHPKRNMRIEFRNVRLADLK